MILMQKNSLFLSPSIGPNSLTTSEVKKYVKQILRKKEINKKKKKYCNDQPIKPFKKKGASD